jgi:Homeodomain-like domain
MAGISLRERVLIGELSQLGMKDPQIAKQLGIKQRTVRKWRQKWAKQGRTGLASQMGRPPQGALSSFPADIAAQLKRWRQAHPGWGPKTLWVELAKHPAWNAEPLPSRASIARWLRQAGKTRPYEKQAQLPQVLSVASVCHEEWEMDARGHQLIEGVGMVSLIQVNDLLSRVKVISYPGLVGQTRIERYPATQDYQLVLRRAFVEWGLPDRLAVDRAHVNLDVHSPTPFPTPLHLWLLALGVQLTFGRPRQPRDQAVTERSHQTWWAQVVVGQHLDSVDSLWQALELRRSFLNEDLPCESLGDRAPLTAFPQARQPRRRYRPEWEEAMLDLERVYHFLGECRWFRRSSLVGTVSLGGHNYSLGKAWYNTEVEVTFDPDEHTFVFQAPPRPEKRLPIRWLTKAFLMGELTPLACFSQFQLMLPFSLEAWRTLHLTRLFETSVP